MLYQLGTVTFEVLTPNIHKVGRSTTTDFAAKDVMGAMRPREHTGEGDEGIRLAGRILPDHLGGLGSLEDLDKMRRTGVAQILVRGDGTNMGWFVIEGIDEQHEYLAKDGVGRWIEFDVALTRAPKPSAASYIRTLLRLFS